MESALTIRVFAKTIGEAKIVLELSVQTIAVRPVTAGRRDANAAMSTLGNLAHYIKHIRKEIGMLA